MPQKTGHLCTAIRQNLIIPAGETLRVAILRVHSWNRLGLLFKWKYDATDDPTGLTAVQVYGVDDPDSSVTPNLQETDPEEDNGILWSSNTDEILNNEGEALFTPPDIDAVVEQVFVNHYNSAIEQTLKYLGIDITNTDATNDATLLWLIGDRG